MDLIGGFDDMPAEFARNVSSKSIFYGIADPKNIKKYDTTTIIYIIFCNKFLIIKFRFIFWKESNYLYICTRIEKCKNI